MLAGVCTIPADEYHADPCEAPSLSGSIAHVLLSQSPRHAWTAHPRLNPAHQRDDDDRFDLGTAAHAYILEGRDTFVVVDAPDWRTRAAQAQRIEARQAGKVPLLAEQWARVQAMGEAAGRALERFHDRPIPLTDGQPEQTLIWREDGGVWCRSRLDWLHRGTLVVDDLKTTEGSANPDAWSRTLYAYGYDVQAAFYLRGVRAVFGADAVFRFVVVEARPPYALSVVSLGPAALALAERKVQRAIDLWRECLAADRWPAYPTRTCYADVPAWEEARWMERELRDDGRDVGAQLMGDPA